MDVIWLKRDVRFRDQGSLERSLKENRKFILLYIYEPDQLLHHSVHGSHILFVNEGLTNIINDLSKLCQLNNTIITRVGEAAAVLQSLYDECHFTRLLSHLECGHNTSFDRDKRVRKWCSINKVEWVEYQQYGIIRGLKSREELDIHTDATSSQLNQIPIIREDLEEDSDSDHDKVNDSKKRVRGSARPSSISNSWSSHWHKFMYEDEYDSDIRTNPLLRQRFQSSIITNLRSDGIISPQGLHQKYNITLIHPEDRVQRQHGGETAALNMLSSFLSDRGIGYNSGISSPIKSWKSCSRLSTYLSWGHISLRTVTRELQKRQGDIRHRRQEIKAKLSALTKRVPKRSATASLFTPRAPVSTAESDLSAQAEALTAQDKLLAAWSRSLASFGSRLRWRSHFMQKFEMEVSIEHQNQCRAFDGIRSLTEYNALYLHAYEEGLTGYPLVDACMRALLATGMCIHHLLSTAHLISA